MTINAFVLALAFGITLHICLFEAISVEATCTSGEFMCDDGNCIQESFTCDGYSHCYDTSDENEHTCPRHWKQEIVLNASTSSFTIKHPLNGGQYHSDEHIHWIVRSEDPAAQGFRIDLQRVLLPSWGDYIIIPRDDCYFDTIIRSTTRNSYFIAGPELNVTFTSNSYGNNLGFILDVTAVHSLIVSPCQGNEKEMFLNENQTTLLITHPVNGSSYRNNEEYIWKIRNEISGAKGFEVSFDEISIEECCDKLRFISEYCSYGKHTYLTKSAIIVRGDSLNITWISDSSDTDKGFTIRVRSLQEVNKTDCYDYTCDDLGRCVRVHYDDLLNWNDSQAACEAEGARLAVITDESMNNLILSAIDSSYSNPWIGILGDSLEDMTWTTGYTPGNYSYVNWFTDWNHVFDKTLCGTFDDDAWKYTDCSYYNWPYVCELL